MARLQRRLWPGPTPAPLPGQPPEEVEPPNGSARFRLCGDQLANLDCLPKVRPGFQTSSASLQFELESDERQASKDKFGYPMIRPGKWILEDNFCVARHSRTIALVGSPSHGTVIAHEIQLGTSILTLRLVARDLLQFRDTAVVAQSNSYLQAVQAPLDGLA